MSKTYSIRQKTDRIITLPRKRNIIQVPPILKPFFTASFIKYAISGATTLILYLSVSFALPQIFDISAQHAVNYGFAISTFYNYAINRFWTYNTTRETKVTLYRYGLLILCGYIIQTLLIQFLPELFSIPESFAIIAFAVTWPFFSFLIMKFVVFE